MQLVSDTFHNRDFWIHQNLEYAKPHFRLEKVARILNQLAPAKKSNLLDVGCGPATLMHLLRKDIHYHGIDLAIHKPAPYLMETDFLKAPIGFGGQHFDIVLAQGVFEYAGRFQSQKFAEIKQILKDDGRFIVSYVNFGHLHKYVSNLYNNIQSIEAFRASLEQFFRVESFFPTSHNWHHHEPSRTITKAAQMRLKLKLPVISRLFAVEYLFICSLPPTDKARIRS